MLRCARCGKSSPEDSSHCPHCGEATSVTGATSSTERPRDFEASADAQPTTLIPAGGAAPPANATEIPDDTAGRASAGHHGDSLDTRQTPGIEPRLKRLDPTSPPIEEEDRTPAGTSAPSLRRRSADGGPEPDGSRASDSGTDSSPSFRPSAFLPKYGGLRAVGWTVVALAILGGIVWGVLGARAGANVETRMAWLVQGNGQELLKIRCDDCPDGTKVAWRGRNATVQSGLAMLGGGGEQLPVGETPVEVVLTPPGQPSVEALVPAKVPYRINADLAPLSEEPPRVAVDVRAMPGAIVSVDGSNVPLNEDGRARVFVDAPALIGPKATAEEYRRKIPYAVSFGHDGARGALTVNENITPLVAGGPHGSITLDSDHFTLAGRTAPNATVQVDGQDIPVAEDGRFAHVMGISEPGATRFSVRASSEAHLPRTVHVNVQRVDDLQAAAGQWRPDAVASYQDLTKPTSIEQKVALIGTIESISTGRHQTRLTVEVQRGCDQQPCLVEVLYAALAPRLSVGDPVEVFGRRLAPRQPHTAAVTPDPPTVTANFIMSPPR